jgi:hypothetical protein
VEPSISLATSPATLEPVGRITDEAGGTLETVGTAGVRRASEVVTSASCDVRSTEAWVAEIELMVWVVEST